MLDISIQLFCFLIQKLIPTLLEFRLLLHRVLYLSLIHFWDYKLIPGSGVDTERYPLQSYPEGGDGIDGDIIVFNYIGRILHDKGVDDYIEAAKQIKGKYPNTEFNMIGFIEPTENHYKKELEGLEKQEIVKYLSLIHIFRQQKHGTA